MGRRFSEARESSISRYYNYNGSNSQMMLFMVFSSKNHIKRSPRLSRRARAGRSLPTDLRQTPCGSARSNHLTIRLS
jgi:hypothetical protein